MFTANQITSAHAKVKSGADFPAYIQELKSLGVARYRVYVTDGHIDYYGADGEAVTTAAKYDPIEVNDKADPVYFKTELLRHQQGQTDYLAFIRMCGDAGVEKWEVRIDKMSCTYYDKKDALVLNENIPDKS